MDRQIIGWLNISNWRQVDRIESQHMSLLTSDQPLVNITNHQVKHCIFYMKTFVINCKTIATRFQKICSTSLWQLENCILQTIFEQFSVTFHLTILQLEKISRPWIIKRSGNRTVDSNPTRPQLFCFRSLAQQHYILSRCSDRCIGGCF